MLKFKDHIWADGSCTCCDDRKVLIDPTDTQRLRKNMASDIRRRVNALRNATNAMINKQDILGLKGSSMMQIAAPGIIAAGTRQEMFQRWFNQAVITTLFGNDNSWLRPYIQRAYLQGTTFANRQMGGDPVTPNEAGHRQDALFALAKMELEGIGNAASQQATRVANLGITTHTPPMAIVRGIWQVLERTMIVRANALVNLIIVKAFGDATLDVYEQRGIAAVGLLPEAQTLVKRDAKTQPKAKTATKDAARKGPGSRVSRKGAGPSGRTIQRIRAAELRVAKAVGESVNVRTAGDDDVCIICEGISEDGPYSINRARSLIPAHPHCRCTFIPADDERYAQDDSNPFYREALSFVGDLEDFNPNHGPDGKFESGGGGKKTSLPEMETKAEAPTPRHGTKKHEVFKTYMQHGKKAAIEHAKQLGLKPTTGSSWTSQWKGQGSHGGSGGPNATPTPFAPPPPSPETPAVTPTASLPKAVSPGRVRKGTPDPKFTHPKIEVNGSGSHLDKVKAGVADIPEEHQAFLAKNGVHVLAQKTVTSGSGSGSMVNGSYKYYANSRRSGHVEVAQGYEHGGFHYNSKDPQGTTVHELGHAIDHRTNWAAGREISAHVDADAHAGMNSDDKLYAKYYFSNHQERFAELYRASYSTGKVAFGMPMHRARKVFAKSIAHLKGMKLV